MAAKPAPLTLELSRIVPALAEANASKGADEPMPLACFREVDRCLELKRRKYVMLKEPATPLPKGRFIPPQQFWRTAPAPRDSFNLFARVSTIGCSDTENKAVAMALVGALLDRQLVCNGKPVLEWGLCRTRVTSGLLTLVYRWDPAQDVSSWDAEAQSSSHSFLYFVVDSAPAQPLTMYWDLSALQFGIFDTPHKTAMPIPYVFADADSCRATHPEVYGEASKWKNSEQIREEYLSLGQMIVRQELPLGPEADIEQKRKIVQLLTNMQKFKSTLELVRAERSVPASAN